MTKGHVNPHPERAIEPWCCPFHYPPSEDRLRLRFETDPVFHAAVYFYSLSFGTFGFTDEDGVRHDGPSLADVRKVADLKAVTPWIVPAWARIASAAPRDVPLFDPAAQIVEIDALLREGGWDGDDVVAGVRGLIGYAEMVRRRG